MLLLGRLCAGDELSHKYETGETVKVWGDRLGPLNSPRESYVFEKIPTCELLGALGSDSSSGLQLKHQSFGDILEGRHAVLSPNIEIKFNQETPANTPLPLCNFTLDDHSANLLVCTHFLVDPRVCTHCFG